MERPTIIAPYVQIMYRICTCQRPYRKDRLPRAYFCCRQLAKFGIVRCICLYNMLLWLVCNNQTLQCFPDCGVWVSVDFDSNTRFYGVKLGLMGYLFMKKKKVQNKNLHNYINISTPYYTRLAQVGVEGDRYSHCAL